MNPQSIAIIPVREFRTTKIRLSGVLKMEERALLTQTLLSNVLNAIDRSMIDRSIVVASNPDEVISLKSGYSKVQVIRESKISGGVSCAMEDGMRFAMQINPSQNMSPIFILMPSDLPFLNSDSLNFALDQKKFYDLIINGSRKRDGTSLLVLERGKKIPLHYDDKSFINHNIEAKKLKLRTLILDVNAFSFDLDDEDDLHLLMSELKSKSFCELIQCLTSAR